MSLGGTLRYFMAVEREILILKGGKVGEREDVRVVFGGKIEFNENWLVRTQIWLGNGF